jgi:hypothetical protein
MHFGVIIETSNDFEKLGLGDGIGVVKKLAVYARLPIR